MDELTKLVLQTHSKALIQLLYSLSNPPKKTVAELYSALEKLGARAQRRQPNNQDYPTHHPRPQPTSQSDHDYYPHAPETLEEPKLDPLPPSTHITPEMAEALLQEAKERQLRARQQRTRQNFNEEPARPDDTCIRPENNLSDF